MIPSSCFNQYKAFHLKSNQTASITPCFSFVHGKHPFCIVENLRTIFGKKAFGSLRFTSIDCMKPNYQSNGEDMTSLDFGEQEMEEAEDSGLPWEGAVIYKRKSSISHVEYCTTLERLGLGKLSTEVSKSRASVMGLCVTKTVKDYPFGTPVLISVDITKKKQKLRLDGIIKTVITLGCNRFSFYMFISFSFYNHGPSCIMLLSSINCTIKEIMLGCYIYFYPKFLNHLYLSYLIFSLPIFQENFP